MTRPYKFFPGAVIGNFVVKSVTAANTRGTRRLVAECVNCQTPRLCWSTNIAKAKCAICQNATREAFRSQGLFYIIHSPSAIQISVPHNPPMPEFYTLEQNVYAVDRRYAITFLFTGTRPIDSEPLPIPEMPEGSSSSEITTKPFLNPRPDFLSLLKMPDPDPNPRYPDWTIVPTLYLPFYLNEDIHESLEEAALTYFNERFKPLSSVRLSDFSHGGTQPWTDQHGNRVAFLYLLDEFSELLSREGPTERLE